MLGTRGNNRANGKRSADDPVNLSLQTYPGSPSGKGPSLGCPGDGEHPCPPTPQALSSGSRNPAGPVSAAALSAAGEAAPALCRPPPMESSAFLLLPGSVGPCFWGGG